MSITTIEPIDPQDGDLLVLFFIHDETQDSFFCDEGIYVSSEEEVKFVVSVMKMWANALVSSGVISDKCDIVNLVEIFENGDWEQYD